MGRDELTDEQWQKIEKMFPANKGKRGGQWQNHRQVVNGMFWILCSGAPWRDLPERYGSWKTVYDRFRRYRIGRLKAQTEKAGYQSDDTREEFTRR